jgi:hypothetical protein
MLLHATPPRPEWTGQAAIVNYHPASSCGRPVLVINGKPIGPSQADWSGYEVLKATTADRELLRLGDYRFDREVA